MPSKRTNFGKGSIYASSTWKRGEFRKAALAQTAGRCAKCGVRGKTASPPGEATISLAHRIPEAVRLQLRRPLTPADVIPLCLRCHGKEDGGRRYR